MFPDRAMDQPMSFCFATISNITRNMMRSEENRLLVTGVINFILAVPTAAFNALVIVAIVTTSSLRTPSYLLLSSLAFSDLAVGLLGQPVFSSTIFLYKSGNAKAYCYFRSASSTLLAIFYCATLLTLTAISVDRYLAIRLKMQYKANVTLRKTRFAVTLIWTLSFASTLQYVVPLTTVGVMGAVVIAVSLFVMLYCYTMSFRALKIHCTQTQPQGNQQQPNSTTQSNAIDVLKYRKILNTMLLVLVLTGVFCIPMLGAMAMFTQAVLNRILAWVFLSIGALNSTLNPVIYLTRMRDLRQACLRILRKTLGMSMPSQDGGN